MKLEDYFKKYPKAKSTYSNRKFLEEIFYPLYNERGLDKLFNEEPFIDEENNNRFIDFVIKSSSSSLNVSKFSSLFLIISSNSSRYSTA